MKRHRRSRLLLLAAFALAVSPFVVAGRPAASDAQQAARDAAAAGPRSLTSGEVMVRGDRRQSGTYQAKGPDRLHGMLWKSPQIFSFAIKPSGGFINVTKVPNVGTYYDFYPSYTTFPGAHFSTPIIADGTVYFALSLGDGHLVAVDAATGQRKWSYKVERHDLSAPAVAGGSIYIGSGDGVLHVLDTATGQEKWRFQAKDHDYGVGSPVIADGVVYFNNLNKGLKGELYALDIQTRQPRWVYREQMYLSAPAIGADAVYLSTWTGLLVALDIKSGQEKWRLKAKTGPPALVDGTLYLSDGKNLSAVDAETGKLKWRASANGNVRAALAVAGDTIWYTGWLDSIYAVDAQTGREKWKYKTKSSCISPIAVDGVVYAGGEDQVFAVDGKTGALKWKIDCEKLTASTPAVADGRIYVVRSDGYVYSFY
ncbi:MAG TPA: PQQ-binding-like beta-propeller repeat protein [Blastocatellia bacterium]|nr:PQQ-binding-like beta-propeller repeat protein [Blastocatellia bacterium]